MPNEHNKLYEHFKFITSILLRVIIHNIILVANTQNQEIALYKICNFVLFVDNTIPYIYNLIYVYSILHYIRTTLKL